MKLSLVWIIGLTALVFAAGCTTKDGPPEIESTSSSQSGVYLLTEGSGPVDRVFSDPGDKKAVVLTCRGVAPGMSQEQIEALKPKGLDVVYQDGVAIQVFGDELMGDGEVLLSKGATVAQAEKVLGAPGAQGKGLTKTDESINYLYGDGLLALDFEPKLEAVSLYRTPKSASLDGDESISY